MERCPLRLTPGTLNDLLVLTKRNAQPGDTMLDLAWPFERAQMAERIVRERIPELPPATGNLFVVELAADSKVKRTGVRS